MGSGSSILKLIVALIIIGIPCGIAVMKNGINLTPVKLLMGGGAGLFIAADIIDAVNLPYGLCRIFEMGGARLCSSAGWRCIS